MKLFLVIGIFTFLLYYYYAPTEVSPISLSAAVADDIVAVTLSGVNAFNPLIAAWIAATVVVELIVSNESLLTM